MTDMLLAAAKEEVGLDLTPMIDCVFLMIIFFVCIDFRVLESKLPAYLPRERGGEAPDLEPQDQLTIRIVVDDQGIAVPRAEAHTGIDPASGRPWPIQRLGHACHWEVGPRVVRDQQGLEQELARVLADRSTWILDATGRSRPLPIVLEPLAGSCFLDVTHTLDTVRGAGFEEVRFGSDLPPRR